MCGIAGASGKGAEILIRKMLDSIKHRGPDGSGMYSAGDITIGNVLLKITGNRSQPISDGGALTYNGEIYNFRNLAERLHLASDSDSEVLYHLIVRMGAEACVRLLDGDYAFAYIRDGKISLSRDQIGVKPLYYAHEGELFAFASEKKALEAVGIKSIFALKPGHVLTFECGKKIQKQVITFSIGEKLHYEKTASKLLFNALNLAVKKRNYKPCGIAFSGGLDSSLIAALCSEPELYSAFMAGSHDAEQSKKAADLLGLFDKLHRHELSTDELESAIPDVIKAVESADPMKVSIALPLFFASRDAHEDGIRVMLSGVGADELFAGYRRYEAMNRVELEKALQKDLDGIAENNLERDDAVSMANAVELRVPYLDREVVELALRMSPRLKIQNGMRKYILRLAAKEILPDELALKEKKAAQYSSGIYPALEKIAKKNGFSGKHFLSTYLEELKRDSV